MQVVKKTALFLIVILLSLAIFAPKRELYYLLEEYLLQQDIVIDNEKIESGLFTLKLQHPDIYVKGIKMAEIREVSLLTLLFYTTITAGDIKPDASLQSWVPRQIDTVSLRYQVLNPMNITLKATGSFGVASGYISIKNRLFHLDITEAKSIDVLKPVLKKGEKGWYYETSF